VHSSGWRDMIRHDDAVQYQTTRECLPWSKMLKTWVLALVKCCSKAHRRKERESQSIARSLAERGHGQAQFEGAVRGQHPSGQSDWKLATRLPTTTDRVVENITPDRTDRSKHE